MAKVSKIQVPTTIDSGSDRTVIPEEMVLPEQFTGAVESFNGVAQRMLQAKVANVTFSIAGVKYQREALALPGEQVFWTAALSFDVCDPRETQHLFGQLRINKNLAEEDSHYMPPKIVEG